VCSEVIVARLASDRLKGRDNGTPGSARARRFLIAQLQRISKGLTPNAAGDAAFEQVFQNGTNLVSIIRGTDLANQYVVVGAHYDHLGDQSNACGGQTSVDMICNGATDNAAGVAAVLGVGRALAHRHSRPRRSVVLALWDSEEDGLLGSSYYTQHPLVPLAKTVGYVNFDIQGANLLPSLRRTTIAVAAETGGSRLQSIVRSGSNGGPLHTAMLSSIFGQFRSDYASFLGVSVPSVFFTDSTGRCYHTAQDETGVVDFGKLSNQIGTALSVTRKLANTNDPPQFASGLPPATYADLLAFSELLERGAANVDLLSAPDQITFTAVRNQVQQLVSDGPAAFGPADAGTLLGDAATMVAVLAHGDCDGFLPPGKRHLPPW
jgi:Peptidase family M28